MTLLGVNWSPIAGDALDLVDYIEVSGWSVDTAPDTHPLTLHNIDLDFSLARPGAIDSQWIEDARRLIQKTGSPWLSMHIGMSAEKVRFDDHMVPLSDTLDRETCRVRILESLTCVRDGIGVPLLLENLDYCPEGAYEHICEPDFIRGTIEELDCNLLLDLAHAQVSADWLGYDQGAYFDTLPLERVMQIHLSSPRRKGDRLDDGHYELLDEDYWLFENLLRRCAPSHVLLEYRRDTAALRRQLERLRESIARHG